MKMRILILYVIIIVANPTVPLANYEGIREETSIFLNLSISDIAQKSFTHYGEEFVLPKKLQPFDIIQDKKGMIWFSMLNDSNIHSLDPNSGETISYELPPAITPLMLKLSGNNIIWFSDHNYQLNEDDDHIGFFNTSSLEVFTIPIANNIAPFDLVIKNDIVYFTEWWGDKIGIYNISSKTLIETNIVCEETNCGPIGLNFDSEENLWYTDSLGGNFVKYNTNTNESKIIKLPTNFVSPVDLAIDDRGLIWTGSHGGDKLLSYNTQNEEIIIYRTPIPEPDAYPVSGINDIEFDSEGDIWFSEHFINRIGKLDWDSKTIHEYFFPRELPLIQWIHSSKDGKIWYAEYNYGIIGYIDTLKAPEFTIEVNNVITKIKQRTSKIIEFNAIYKRGLDSTVSITSFGEIKNVLGFNFQKSEYQDITLGEKLLINLKINIGDNAWKGIYEITIGIIGEDFSASKSIFIEILDNPKSFVEIIIPYSIGIIVGIIILTAIYYKKFRSN